MFFFKHVMQTEFIIIIIMNKNIKIQLSDELNLHMFKVTNDFLSGGSDSHKLLFWRRLPVCLNTNEPSAARPPQTVCSDSKASVNRFLLNPPDLRPAAQTDEQNKNEMI